MSEQVGVSKIGETTFSQIFTNTADQEVISAVLPGGSAVTYPLGTALVDGATIGTKAKYTNAPAIGNEAVATGDGSTTTFDLDQSNVLASTLKGFVAGVEWDVTLSVGTGAGGKDQIVFATAPTNSAAITADYNYHSSSKGVTGACILMAAEATTVAGGNVISNGLVSGTVNSSKIVDSAAAAVDSFFKAALPKIRFA